MLAGKAPIACRTILARRRPDVVLGSGGYVAGPMVLAAATRRIPAAIMEADAHLGLANRLALPFARRVFLAFPIPGRTGPKYRVTGRPIPARSRAIQRDEARRRFELPLDGPSARGLRREPGCPDAQRGRRRGVRRRGAARPPSRRRARLRNAPRPRAAGRLSAAAVHARLRRRARGRRPRTRARRGICLRARRRGDAGSARPVSARHS